MLKTKKLLSVLVAAVMVVCMLAPVSVLAEGQNVAEIVGGGSYTTLSAAINAATAGDTIVLLDNVSVNTGSSTSSRLPISKSMTIDGNGYTISINNRGFGVGMNATAPVDVTFKNVTITNATNGGRCVDTRGNLNSLTLDNATLSTTGTSGYLQPLTIGGDQSTKATVTVKDSTIKTSEDGSKGYAVITFNPVDMTITNSTVKGWACFYAKASDGSAGSAGSTYTVKDSTLVSKNVNSGTTNAFGTIVSEDADIDFTFTGCDISIDGSANIQALFTNNEDYAQTYAPGTVVENVTATFGEGNNVELKAFGDFIINPTDGNTIIITGGTFSSDPSEYVADGFMVVENNDDTYSVVGAVASIDGVNYASLEAAVEAAQDGDTIVLLKDVTYEEGHRVGIWQVTEFNLDLNGHTLTTNAGADTFWASAVCYGDYTVESPARNVTISNGTIRSAYGTGVYASDKVTVTLSGLDVKQDSTKVQSTAEYSSAIRLTCGATVIVEDGEYEGRYSVVVSNSGGNAVINGGTFVGDIFFSAQTSSGAVKTITINGGNFTGNFVNTNKGTLTITGGTFSSDPSDYVADGYIVVINGNGTYTVEDSNVAKIGSVKYATLAAAIAAANEMENATVTLLKDYNMEANEPGYGWTTSYVAAGENTPRDNMIEISGTGLTLDLNGHTLSNLYNNTFKVTGQNVTVENGTMTIGTLYAGSYSAKKGVTLYGTPRLCSYVILANNAKNFTINDLTTTGGINISTNTTATINGLNFSGASYYAICSQEGSKVTINGGTFDKATAGYANLLVWVEDETDSDMIINGGTFLKGSASFCDTSDGLPVIYGGTFDFDPTNFGVANGYEAVNNNNGTWTVGEVKAGNLTEAVQTTENFDATYTVTKQIVDANNQVIDSGTARTVNVKVVTEEIVTENTATVSDDTVEQIIDNLDMGKVLDNVVASVADAEDTVAVEIQVIRDLPEIVENTITYEVHPIALVYVNDAVDPSETFVISNEALKDDAVFTITLPVPDALAAQATGGYIQVIHKSEGYEDDVQVYKLKGEAGAYYVQFNVTHFSEFELSASEQQTLFTGHSLTLNGYINLNFYLNLTADQITTGEGVTVNYSWARGNASYHVTADDYVAGRGYKTTVALPAAEMNYPVTASVTINGVAQSDTDVYSVRDYAIAVIKDSGSSVELVNLAQTMLDYGAKAQVVFNRNEVSLANSGIDYTMESVTSTMIDLAIEQANGDDVADDMFDVAAQLGADYYTSSVIYLSGCTLRHYFTGALDSAQFTGVKSNYYYYIDVTNIAAAQLDTLQTFTVGEVTFKYSALDFVKAIIESGTSGTATYDLAAATYWYNQAANAYFGQ